VKPIETLVIAQRQSLEVIRRPPLYKTCPGRCEAAGSIGVPRQATPSRASGADSPSYLPLRGPRYTSELIELGESDKLARRDEVARFFRTGRVRSERKPGRCASARKLECGPNDAPSVVNTHIADGTPKRAMCSAIEIPLSVIERSREREDRSIVWKRGRRNLPKESAPRLASQKDCRLEADPWSRRK